MWHAGTTFGQGCRGLIALSRRGELEESEGEGRSRGLSRREESGGFGRFGCGGEDGLLVGLYHAKPTLEVM